MNETLERMEETSGCGADDTEEAVAISGLVVEEEEEEALVKKIALGVV